METNVTSRVALLREPNPELLRTPPYNTEAEQALLGAILINNTAYYRVCEFLQPEHFGNAVHGRIFAAIGKLLGRGQIANPVTLKNLFDQDGALTEIGGAQYLARLGGRRGGNHQCRGLRPRRARPLPAARADRARRGCRQRRVSPGSRRSGARADRTGGKKAVRPRHGRGNGGRVSRVRDRADERDPQCRGGFQAQRQNRRGRHRVCRSRSQAGRAAPFRSCRPRRQAVDGQDGAGHQHRVLRSAKLPAHGCLRPAQGRRGRGGRRLLFARNVGGAVRHPDSRRGVRCLLRPHPARRCQP